MKIMDGGMLLLKEKTESGGFVIVAPHGWTRVKTSLESVVTWPPTM